ncbi:MAG: NAD(P)H-hydrate dehydratase [Chloroflexi bacterium]|nr:NAD(P)H-hydrate dehydratase [Chloroflexota bacterium]
MKIVTVAQMQALERQAGEAGISTAQLVERAGQAVARELRALFSAPGRPVGGSARPKVVVLAGPGNNGGDGLVAARHLADWGAPVRVYLLSPRPEDDPNFQALLERGVPVLDVEDPSFHDALSHSLAWADVALDAVLGTGRARALEGAYRAAVEVVNRARAAAPSLRVVALDLPTGLDADTGAADPSCMVADVTITLGCPKRGLFSSAGAAAAGRITVVDIGIPKELFQDIPDELMTDDLVAALLPRRPLQANKGTFGRVLAVAGSGNYVGAAMLACRGAQRVGAGLVTLAAPRSLIAMVAGALAEATYAPLPETATGAISRRATQELLPLLSRYDVVLLGCGLGQHPETQAFVHDLLLSDTPLPPHLVLDADGLNTLSGTATWWKRVKGGAVLTPHPGEMARLAGVSVAEVQQDRMSVARRAAQEWGQVVALKGAYTVVASPQGGCRVSPYANPALASAGTGDVLAGVIAGLLAQGVSPFDAASAGVYLHGLAGQRFSERNGDTGLLASDLLPLLPELIHSLKGRGY